jgi:hypothetical protein
VAAGLGAGVFRGQSEDVVPVGAAAGKRNPPPG